MIKIILTEDHNIVRDGIRSLLENERDIEVIAEATNGPQLLSYLAAGMKPDLILTDMNMPGMDGLQLIKSLQNDYPVLILSMLDHENYVLEANREGARGYLLKNVSRDELLFAIRFIANGGKYICSELSFKMLDKLANINEHRILDESPEIELSDREAEVLGLIAEGLTNNEMADKLFSSRRTIEGHRKSLLEKTGTTNTATLIKYAVQCGLIK